MKIRRRQQTFKITSRKPGAFINLSFRHFRIGSSLMSKVGSIADCYQCVW